MLWFSRLALSRDCRLGLPGLAEQLRELLPGLLLLSLESGRMGARGLEQKLPPPLRIDLPEQLVDALPVLGSVVAAGHAASRSSAVSATSSTRSRAGRRKTPTITIAATISPPRTSNDVWKPFTAAGALVTATE